jgi:hypothetical protein
LCVQWRSQPCRHSERRQAKHNFSLPVCHLPLPIL